ncbi:MAG: hypothetical protein M3P22_01720 [bacterium]|nr:hypothetical protein [bacterium]
MKKNIPYIILIIILLAVGSYLFLINYKKSAVVVPDSQNNSDTIAHYATFKSSEYSPEFAYPKLWGEVATLAGNKVCPEEDTYRTVETLSVFKWEFGFKGIKLPNSESVIHMGVRFHELDPKKLNGCGDDFLLQIATKKVQPETLSSVRLVPLTNQTGLSGVYNEEASRLNTESRKQYTFFVNGIGGKVYVLQSYMSFIPYFGSPELKELDGVYKGDIAKYLAEGKTSATIRNYFNEFIKLSQSLKFSGEGT